MSGERRGGKRGLASCRVLDLGIITAGAATSAILADLGAEVLKIESPSYKDPFRIWTNETLPGEHPDLPPFFRMTNRGKLNVAIDLKRPDGRETILRLVRHCDVVVENFSRGVLDRLGLGYEALRAANPEIILASISSQGDDGPDAAYVSFGSTLEAMAGMAAITGYADGPPVVSGIELNYPDQVVAIFAASMIATAVLARDEGGGGAHLDLSQRELTSFLCGEAFLDSAAATRRGNAQAGFALQDCFRARDGRWVAVSVLPGRVGDLAGLAGGGDAASLRTWLSGRDADEAVRELSARGIDAATVLDAGGVLDERDASWSLALRTGPDGEAVKGFVFEDEGFAMSTGAPAALMGTHSREVLGRIGGFSEAEIAALAASGAVMLGGEA